MKPAAKDLDRRRPVWEAMSGFFLDTELDDDDFSRIADVLAASGYSRIELDEILWRELCPVLGWNLAPVAGEWAGFDMKWVEERILHDPPGVIRRWRSYYGGGRIAKHAWKRAL